MTPNLCESLLLAVPQGLCIGLLPPSAIHGTEWPSWISYPFKYIKILSFMEVAIMGSSYACFTSLPVTPRCPGATLKKWRDSGTSLAYFK